ncbi:M48 family metallopeptidase [Pinirhizobacter soli]|uniref:M48 family metallopeptidase n=1 Tax=Pinirhizobacter soli TaxID=2786953 RepID=UPI00202A3005|nr:M48 family metallopeptidase [Pinirhizobacter soli]
MDFFAQQARMRGTSRRLVFLFVLAILGIVFVVDAVVWFAWGHRRTPEDGQMVQSSVGLLVMSSAAVLAVIAGATLFRMASLRGGGSAVALQMGARQIPPDTNDPDLRRLRNVIEEVAIAAGVPMPDIFIMEEEMGINAFAAGYAPTDAAVCVTRGALAMLTRDELQGVIAHEFSHVINGDMRLNIKLMGLLFGILVLTIIGRQILWWGPGAGRKRDNNGIVLVGLALVVAGWIGYFFARLIQAAVARSRESLADASAVQFTRQTAGIAGALKKIARAEEGSRLQRANAQEVAHMLFGEAGRFNSLFATHPPIYDRIRALEPEFDAQALEREPPPEPLYRQADEPPPVPTGSHRSPWDAVRGQGGSAPVLPIPGVTDPRSPLNIPGVMIAAGAGLASQADAPAAVAAQVGSADASDLQRAEAIRKGLPDDLRQAVRNSEKAQAVLLAMALGNGPQREAQLKIIDSIGGNEPRAEVLAVEPMVRALDPSQRLPIASLAFPALRRWSSRAITVLINALNQMAHADGQVDLDEYCLVKLVTVQLSEALNPRGIPLPGTGKLAAARGSFALVCAVVAQFGNDDPLAARKAWQAGMNEALAGDTSAYAPPPDDWQGALDAALAELDRLAPMSKELMVRGLTSVVMADGTLRRVEAELLRVICATLHCPLPALA